jgi:transcriptional regulator with XRE-family HTH domain
VNLGQDYRHIEANFAGNVRTHREARGISQEELAQRMTERGFGFSQATVWKIEQGKRPVKIDEAAALADALGLITWSSLFASPQDARHVAAVQAAVAAAQDAYKQLKRDTTRYLQLQEELAMAIHTAREAGLAVFDGYAAWLSELPERAVLQARTEHSTEDEHREQVHATVEAAITPLIEALRAHGIDPIIDLAEITTIPGSGPLVLEPTGNPDGQEHYRGL